MVFSIFPLERFAIGPESSVVSDTAIVMMNRTTIVRSFSWVCKRYVQFLVESYRAVSVIQVFLSEN